jgi:DNA-binding GntR family transcriptional regulator
VATISESDLEQIYIMRRHLETELLKSVVIPASAPKHLRAANRRFAKAAVAGDVNGVLRTNRAFHFEIFGWSPKTRILEEVVRLWDISEFHRSLFAYVSYAMDEAVRSQIVREHDLVIDAVESGTTRDVIRTMAAHRASSENRLIPLVRDRELPAIGGRSRAPGGNSGSSSGARG